MSKKTKKLKLYPTRIALILIIPSLALYLFFTIWPISYSIFLAFTNANEKNIAPAPEKIKELELEKKCVLEANKSREEIIERFRFVYEKVVDAQEKLLEVNDTLYKAYIMNRTINSTELYGIIGAIEEAYYDIDDAQLKATKVFPCSYNVSVDPGPTIKNNLSAVSVFLSSNLSARLNAYRVTGLKPSDIPGILDAINNTLYRINLTLTSIETVAKDFDGFIKSVLEDIDNRISELQLRFVGLENINELLHDSRFIYSIYKTLLFVVTSVPLKVSVGVLLAFFFSSELIYGRKIMRALLLTPWAMPVLLSVTTWRMMFEPGTPLQQAFSYLVGHDFLLFAGCEWDAFILYNIVEMWLAYPFIMTVTMGAIAGIPKEIIEATYIDGAGVWLRFRKVLLPQVIRPVLFATVLTTGASLQAFMVPLLINGGGPTGLIKIPGLEPRYGNYNEFLILYGYDQARIYNEYGLASAVYLVVVVFLAIYVLAWLKIAYKRE